MEFKAFSIERFVDKHLLENPSADRNWLREKLVSALADYRKGVRCNCGSDIWVVGSALSGGSGCFTCITGELSGKNIPEIEGTLKKKRMKDGRRHISDLAPHEINGIFDDDGFEVLPHMIRKPALCMLCKLNNDVAEEHLCNLTRFDQRNSGEFDCSRFRRG